MAKSIQDIKQACEEIRTATSPNSNTAEKVGGTIKDIVEFIESNPPSGGTDSGSKITDIGEIEVSYDGDSLIEVNFRDAGNNSFELTAARNNRIGLMTSADKVKLDSLVNYEAATPIAAGLMSAEDKRAIDKLKTTRASGSQDGILKSDHFRTLMGNLQSATFTGLRTGHWLEVARIRNTPYNFEDVTINVYSEQGQIFDSLDLRICGNGNNYIRIKQGERFTNKAIFGSAAACKIDKSDTFDVIVMVCIKEMPWTNNILEKININTRQIKSIYDGRYNVQPTWLPDGPSKKSYGSSHNIGLTEA